MFNLGDQPVNGTVYCYFDTFDSNGASVTISGLAVTDVEIFKNGSMTQRASDNGYALLDTDGIDLDGSTGFHGFSVDLSDNSDSGFYAAGSHYLVHIDAITVDSQTVRFSFEFTIGRLLRPATSGRTVVVDSAGLVDANAVKVGPTGSGTAQTARDLGAGVNVSQVGGQTASAAGTVTFPGTIASTTNITAATGITVATLGAGVVTASSIAASALNDKGNWLQPFVAGRTLKIDFSGSVEQVLLVSGFGDDAILPSTFSPEARTQMASDVWANATRTLTAGTNIVLAKGTGVTGFNDIAAGAAMTLANGALTTAAIADGAITDAKFTVPTVTGVAPGVLSKLVQTWMFHYLPSEYDPDDETFKTFATNGTTVVTTQSATVVGNVQRKGNAT